MGDTGEIRKWAADGPYQPQILNEYPNETWQEYVAASQGIQNGPQEPEVDYTRAYRRANAKYQFIMHSSRSFYAYYEDERGNNPREFHRRRYPWFIGPERNIAQRAADLHENTRAFGHRVRLILCLNKFTIDESSMMINEQF